MAMVPAHTTETPGTSKDFLSDIAKEVSFKRLAGARIKLTLRDLFIQITIPRISLYAFVIRVVETIGCYMSENRGSTGVPNIFDLLWDQTSPYIVAMQCLGCLLDPTCKHPLVDILEGQLATFSHDEVGRFREFERELNTVAQVWLFVKGPALLSMPEIQLLGYGDLRRTFKDRNALLDMFLVVPRERLTPGWGQRILDFILSMEEIDIEYLVMLFFITAALTNCHTQDIEALHAALRNIIVRGGGACEYVPWHLVNARALNKQVLLTTQAASTQVANWLKALGDIDRESLAVAVVQKCVKSPLLAFFNNCRKRDKVLYGKVPEISDSYWNAIRGEWLALEDWGRSEYVTRVQQDLALHYPPKPLALADRPAPPPIMPAQPLESAAGALVLASGPSAEVSAGPLVEVNKVHVPEELVRIPPTLAVVPVEQKARKNVLATKLWFNAGIHKFTKFEDGTLVLFNMKDKTVNTLIATNPRTREVHWHNETSKCITADRGHIPAKFVVKTRQPFSSRLAKQAKDALAAMLKKISGVNRIGGAKTVCMCLKLLQHFERQSASLQNRFCLCVCVCVCDFGTGTAHFDMASQISQWLEPPVGAAQMDRTMRILGCKNMVLQYKRLPFIKYTDDNYGLQLFTDRINIGRVDYQEVTDFLNDFCHEATRLKVRVCKFRWLDKDRLQLLDHDDSVEPTVVSLTTSPDHQVVQDEGANSDDNVDWGARAKRRRAPATPSGGRSSVRPAAPKKQRDPGPKAEPESKPESLGPRGIIMDDNLEDPEEWNEGELEDLLAEYIPDPPDPLLSPEAAAEAALNDPTSPSPEATIGLADAHPGFDNVADDGKVHESSSSATVSDSESESESQPLLADAPWPEAKPELFHMDPERFDYEAQVEFAAVGWQRWLRGEGGQRQTLLGMEQPVGIGSCKLICKLHHECTSIPYCAGFWDDAQADIDKFWICGACLRPTPEAQDTRQISFFATKSYISEIPLNFSTKSD